MSIRIANAPCSWGALEFDLGDEGPGGLRILREMAQTGYAGTELGDWGLLPTEPEALSAALVAVDLELVGAFVPVPWIAPDAVAQGVRDALRVARLLAAVAARPFLILADDNGADPRRRADYDTEHKGEARADARPAPRRPGSEEEGGGAQAANDAAEHEVSFRAERRSAKEREEATQQLLITAPRKRRRRGRVPGMERVHEQVMARLGKARRHFKAAVREAEAGNWVSASSNAYLAMTFDPEEAKYRAIWEEYDPKGRSQLARQHIQLAESAMSYHNLKAAVHNYQMACAAGPPNAEPYFQLAQLLLQSEDQAEPSVGKPVKVSCQQSATHSEAFPVASSMP